MTEEALPVPVQIAIIAIGAVGAVAGIFFAIARSRAIRRYGRPALPADLQDLCENIGRRHFVVVAADFTVIERRKRRALLERTYAQIDGTWTLQLEMEDERLIAFSARFASTHTKLLNEERSGQHGVPVFLSSD